MLQTPPPTTFENRIYTLTMDIWSWWNSGKSDQNQEAPKSDENLEAPKDSQNQETPKDSQNQETPKDSQNQEAPFRLNNLANLENKLNTKILGQPHAVALTVAALMRYAADIRNTNTPIASFLFVGPTGVGKTQLAKELAKELLGSETHLVRNGFDYASGARPLKRVILNAIVTPIAQKIVMHEILPGDSLAISYNNQRLCIGIMNENPVE